jgi:small subunit ribosomal protein S2
MPPGRFYLAAALFSQGGEILAIVTLRELLDAGVHYGHRTSRRNPKMDRYIFAKRNAIHIVDLRETIRGLIKATRFLHRIAEDGQTALLVGTKRQAAPVLQECAERSQLPYVNNRWLGGTLTNFRTIRSRLGRLEELEALEDTGEIANYSKKMIATLQREKRKIKANLEGIRKMSRLPGALIVIDPRREKIAVYEAYKLGIPIVALTDTDADPSLVDIPIPGNDDAIRCIQLMLDKLTNAFVAGRASYMSGGADAKPDADAMAAAAQPARPAVAVPEKAHAPAEAADAQQAEPEQAGPADQATTEA